MKFSDIKKFPFSGYSINVCWKYLQNWLREHNEGIMQLELNPAYQRGYVWEREQQIAYIEFMLRGGRSGRDIFWNCPTWGALNNNKNILELVDGKQRIQAALDFLNNKIPAFNIFYREYEDDLFGHAEFIFHVHNLRLTSNCLYLY